LWSATLDLLSPDQSAQIETPRSAESAFCAYQKSVRSSESWAFWSKVQSYECNDWAIHNSLKRRDLELPRILNFEESLYGQENATDWKVAAIEIS
jgi:hypothetical protein